MVLGNLLIVVTEQLMGVSSAEIKGYSILLVRDLQDVKMNRVLCMSDEYSVMPKQGVGVTKTLLTSLLLYESINFG